MAASRSVLELIGNTPLLELTHLDTGPCQLFIKLENQNPGGTIIEATANNTGIGVALVTAMKGYKLILVVLDKMSREKIYHLRALGTDVMCWKVRLLN
ncbi:cystathionine beta-synthase [Xenorhabdus koppenhoeferi]|uniref:cysteine synthase n=1 Tax=Xenorhabdus koppenhoeferi TaxID=351659 RepID=A0A1I7IDG6_9GAMM|nr:cystathionine beta-synthase [Xenorhabdus koppenhoeferi]